MGSSTRVTCAHWCVMYYSRHYSASFLLYCPALTRPSWLVVWFSPKTLFRKISQNLHYITHFPQNFPIFLSRKEKKNHWVAVVFFFSFFLSLWCCWSGDHQKDNLAKFGYINYGSKSNLSLLLYCWLPTGTLNCRI